MVYTVHYEDCKGKVTAHEVFVDNYCFHSLCFSATVKLNKLITLETLSSLYKPSNYEGLSISLYLQVTCVFIWKAEAKQRLHPHLRVVCCGFYYGFEMLKSISSKQHSVVPIYASMGKIVLDSCQDTGMRLICPKHCPAAGNLLLF